MFGVGGGEILVIALVALILFGTDDLPKNMRKFMKAWNDFRGVTNDLQRSWLDVRDQVTRDILTERAPLQPTDAAQQSTAEAGSEVNVSDTAPVTGEQTLSSASPVESLTEKTIFDSDQQEEDLAPTARPAQGALARGQLDESAVESVSDVSSARGPDKST